VGPARIFIESLTRDPELENNQGHDLPIRQRRTPVSSTPNSCRSRCTAMTFGVVPSDDAQAAATAS
jgi:hypothetical protein